MTVYLLLSDEEPLFEDLRQRLSSCTESSFVVVVSETIPVRTVLQKLSLVLREELTGFENMKGIHRISCSGAELFVARMTRREYLKSASVKPDVIFDKSLLSAGTLKRFLAGGAVLVAAEIPENIPPFLCAEAGEWRMRGTSPEPEVRESRDVLVIGAGLAGSMVSWELSKRGRRPIVIDAGMVPGSGASALYAGLIHPHWQQSDSPLFQLTRAGFEAMVSLFEEFPETFIPVGVLDAASSQEEYLKWGEAYRQSLPIPMAKDFAYLMNREEAREKTGLELSRGGWYFPKAGLVHAGKLCRRLTQASGAKLLTNTAVRLECEEGIWVARTEYGQEVARAPKAVVCAALNTADVLGIPGEWLGMSGLYGRISLLRDIDLKGLKTALTGDGYVARTDDGFCAVGATYEPGEERKISSARAHEHNLSTFPKLLEHTPEVIARGFYEGTRAVAHDRMPLAGKGFVRKDIEGLSFRGVPEAKAIPRSEGLWICAGMGSRGITWGLACARYVASGITGEPVELTRQLEASLDPARFLPKLLAGSGKV